MKKWILHRNIILIIAALLVGTSATISASPQAEPIDGDKKIITISAAGDCTLGYDYRQSTWNRFDTVAKQKGYAYFLQNVKPIFEKDDLTIINLEGPLTTANTPAKKEFTFKGDPKYVSILTTSSVEAADLANNHTRDYGESGYKETQKVLEKAGIGFFDDNALFYKTIKGIRVAVIGVKGWTSDKQSKDHLTKLITKAKSKSDLIIVMFHWGEERNYYPTQIQNNLAKHAIDAGAHLVLGSHPHVIQGISKYHEKNIVYSMGNFCFGGNRNPSDKDSFIYQETFELTDKGIVSLSNQVIPCSISSVKDHNDYRPTPLIGNEKKRFEDKLAKYSRLK